MSFMTPPQRWCPRAGRPIEAYDSGRTGEDVG
jgi:hypothetical protein